MAVEVKNFGVNKEGKQVSLYTISNRKGMKACLTDLGAILVELWVPAEDGEIRDVVQGFDTVAAYEANPSFFGATIGPNANRIADARFTLDGEEHHLSRNRGAHHLHGGFCGFQRRFWRVSAVEEGDEPAVSLSLHSPHGDEGYPGNLDVTVTYRLRSGGTFEICFESACDRATILNLINHVAFQLGGLSEENIRTHRLFFLQCRFL